MKSILFFLLLPTLVSAQNQFFLSESSLKELIDAAPPRVQEIEALLLTKKRRVSEVNDQYSTQLEAEAAVTKSKARILNRFVPVTESSSYYSLGVSRQFVYGGDASLSLFSDQSTNNFVADATTSGVLFSMSFDLYKNFLGRVSKANLNIRKSELERGKVEKIIQVKTFHNELRKIYWSLVANSEAIKLTKSLLSSSEKHLANTKKRFRSQIADEGEVAKSLSQVSTRRAGLNSLEYEKSVLHQNLKRILPSVSEKEIVLSKYNVESTIVEVLLCGQLINQKNKAPLEYTHLDEMIKSLKEEEKLQKVVANSYDGLEIKFVGEFSKTGKAFDRSNSFDDFNNSGGNAYGAGVVLTFPLDGKKKNTQDIIKEVIRKNYEAQERDYEGRLNAFHTQMIRSVDLLQKVIINHRNTDKHLSKSLSAAEKKYSQARITAQQLILEQDAFLENSLNDLQTKVAIIHAFMDYFSVFTDMPCSLNKVLL